MQANELKKIQTPLKEKYKTDANSALITLRANGKIGDGISCKIESGQKLIDAGLHPATGGTGLQLCSGDLLLESLVACAGVTLTAVATALEFNLVAGEVKAEGDLDFRGTLGIDKEVKVGFTAIRLHFLLDTTESQERIDTLLKLTERYCVVYQTLASGTALNATIKTKT